MKFGIRKWLEPDEEVLFDIEGHSVGKVQHVVFILFALGIAAGTAFMVKAYLKHGVAFAETAALPGGEAVSPGVWLAILMTGLFTFAAILTIWISLLKPPGILLTERRVIRWPGKYRWPFDFIPYADIAKVCTHGSRITLIASAPDAMRSLCRDGQTVPADSDRITAELSRWKFPGAREYRHDRALRILGAICCAAPSASPPPSAEDG